MRGTTAKISRRFLNRQSKEISLYSTLKFFGILESPHWKKSKKSPDVTTQVTAACVPPSLAIVSRLSASLGSQFHILTNWLKKYLLRFLEWAEISLPVTPIHQSQICSQEAHAEKKVQTLVPVSLDSTVGRGCHVIFSSGWIPLVLFIAPHFQAFPDPSPSWSPASGYFPNCRLPFHAVTGILCWWSGFWVDGLMDVESESHSVMFNYLWPHGLYSLWNSPGQNTGVGSLSLLQGNLPNPGIEPRSPALQADLVPAEPQGKPLP